MMKKKTVITTEKHEVWVIRQAGDSEELIVDREPESGNESLSLAPEQPDKNDRDNPEE